MHCWTQCHRPCTRPPSTHTSTGDSWTLTGKSGSVSCGVPAPLSQPWCTQVLFLPPTVCFLSPVEVQALWWGLWRAPPECSCHTWVCCTQGPAPVAAHRWSGPLQEALKHSRYCIVIDYSPYTVHFILLTPLFFSWNFVHLNLPHLFAFPNPLSSGHHLFILWIYNSISVSFFCLFIFVFLDSTYKWNHLVFDFLCMIYFT